MREVTVYRGDVNAIAGYLTSLQDLRVRLGDNVELECSTSASETPQYFWAKEVRAVLGVRSSVGGLNVEMLNSV